MFYVIVGREVRVPRALENALHTNNNTYFSRDFLGLPTVPEGGQSDNFDSHDWSNVPLQIARGGLSSVTADETTSSAPLRPPKAQLSADEPPCSGTSIPMS